MYEFISKINIGILSLVEGRGGHWGHDMEKSTLFPSSLVLCWLAAAEHELFCLCHVPLPCYHVRKKSKL